MSPRALDIIRTEHRSLAAVLHALQYLARGIEEHGAAPDYALLRLMVDYIESFHQRFHHPKEDEHLFKAIRSRTHDGDTLLAELEAQHAEGDGWLQNLREAVNQLQASGGRATAEFARAVDVYADFHWRHMRREEDEVMPLAERVLSAADWTQIDAAFTSNDDPMFGAAPQEKYAALFKLILSQAPPPVGYGGKG
ncbi:MAG TPA: hemerythrin domain-containing protein [Burkholderiales bacterium]|jgi:hemerythrin-like domain-containing protein|nr:hemerythrin domain-containing protein [Burkholderiales bacterium]